MIIRKERSRVLLLITCVGYLLSQTDSVAAQDCGRYGKRCVNGICIRVSQFCDGIAQCTDGSDESIAACSEVVCESDEFGCGYGACIPKDRRCDGKIDCHDGSDENKILCNYTESITTPAQFSVNIETTTAPSTSCHITHLPENGRVEHAAPPNKEILINMIVPSLTRVNYKCLPNYSISGSTSNVCLFGMWQDEVPDCKRYCNPQVIHAASIFSTSCTLNGENVRCDQPANVGTIALVNCRDRYQRDVTATQQVIVCGDDGIWSPSPVSCSPICGEEAPNITPYVIGGYRGNITSVPWHVAVYKRRDDNWQYHCGGTIINARAVVSAMHCFWDPSTDRPYDPSIFRVVTGKEKLDINAKERYATQEFDVERIYGGPGYNHASGNYAADIALLILKSSIEFKTHIAPICIPYGLNFEETVVPRGWIGRVAGWGLTSSGGAPSEHLKIIEVPSIERQTCFDESTLGFRSQITPDKFCAGYLNSNVSVCQGDSGGGLVFPSKERGRTVYYLRGIVSTGANKLSSCDSDHYTTFTNILYYESFIRTYETRHRPK